MSVTVFRYVVVLAILFVFLCTHSSTGDSSRNSRNYSYKVVQAYPHDPGAYTQGLVFHNGVLYEGTGRYGESSLRKVELETGEVIQRYDIPAEFFGEGITILGDMLIQLTLRSRTGFLYDKKSLELLREFRLTRNGWGITHDGRRLIVSDGSSTLYFLDPGSFAEIGRLEVRDGAGPVSRLNELEYVRGEIFANVWLSDRIARISPDTGDVLGWIDLAGLSPFSDNAFRAEALNGIAYDAGGDRLFVTGKLWPQLFEIQVIPGE